MDGSRAAGQPLLGRPHAVHVAGTAGRDRAGEAASLALRAITASLADIALETYLYAFNGIAIFDVAGSCKTGMIPARLSTAMKQNSVVR